jgi:sterol desaturase/sphingolipid hydroxylase (fatty acid hydroxylase superfamily)/uncharacterized protein (DUF2141 family)
MQPHVLKWQHARVNAALALTALPVQFILGFAFAFSTTWVTTHHFGLIQWLVPATNRLETFLFSLILLDFTEYFYHRFMHTFKALWRIHLVHHSDESVDVSTVLREHPAETFIRLSNTLLCAFLLGVPLWCLVFRQIIQVLFTVGSHVSVRLPERLDRILGWVFITPNLHHVHHHYKQPFTDRNYGDILSIWDRMFGTFARMEAQKITFGVDACPEPVGNASGVDLLKLPLKAPKVIVTLAAACLIFTSAFVLPAYGTLTFDVSGMDNSKGVVRVVLYNSDKTFLSENDFALADSAFAKANGRVEITLHNVPFGTYAAAIYQDENQNGVIDQNLVKIPTEPYAFSNGVRAKWTVPDFKDVSFRVDQASEHFSTVLHYWSQQ